MIMVNISYCRSTEQYRVIIDSSVQLCSLILLNCCLFFFLFYFNSEDTFPSRANYS